MKTIPEEQDVDVIERDNLDEAHQKLHAKPWLVVYPNGFIVGHDTEEAACLHQQAHRLAVLGVPGQVEDEGWALFAVDGRYQLQRLDAKGIFDSDVDALLYVSQKAIEGSKRHLAALQKIGKLIGD